MLFECVYLYLQLQSRTIKYGELCIDIKEGALGDGLGARVWVVAHTLCRSEQP